MYQKLSDTLFERSFVAIFWSAQFLVDDMKFSQMIDWVDAIDFVQPIVEVRSILTIFWPFEVRVVPKQDNMWFWSMIMYHRVQKV